VSKYDPLRRHLQSQNGLKISMTFREIEAIIGVPLPASAFAHRAWWANSFLHPQAGSWLYVGWSVSKVNIKKRAITFDRFLQFTIGKAKYKGKEISLEISFSDEEVAIILSGPDVVATATYPWSNIIQRWIDANPDLFASRPNEPTYNAIVEMLVKLGYHIANYEKVKPRSKTKHRESAIEVADDDNLLWI
jgi:hypothetical protein